MSRLAVTGVVLNIRSRIEAFEHRLLLLRVPPRTDEVHVGVGISVRLEVISEYAHSDDEQSDDSEQSDDDDSHGNDLSTPPYRGGVYRGFRLVRSHLAGDHSRSLSPVQAS